jgi:hypothetical protein
VMAGRKCSAEVFTKTTASLPVLSWCGTMLA